MSLDSKRGFITYLVKDVISVVKLRWGHVVAHVPTLFTNELSSIARCDITHTSRWLYCIHLGVDIRTNLCSEFLAQLLALSWAFLR